METAISAAVTAVVTLAVCLINNYFQNQKTIALIDFRLKELEKKVDKHSAAYMKLRREIIQAEGKLKAYNDISNEFA